MPCVVFDIGGVLVRIRQTWLECSQAAGVAISEEAARATTTAFPPFEPYQAGTMSVEAFLAELGRHLGTANADDTASVHNAMLAEAYEGTAALASELKGLGIATGCLSNTNGLHWPILYGSGAYPAIDGLDFPMASHAVVLAKPMPEIYRRFEALSCHPPEALWYFDDHPRYVEAARQLGWNANLIVPEDGPERQMRAVLSEAGLL